MSQTKIKHKNQTTHHAPVLLEEVLEYLDPQAGERYLDLTAGYGGHSSAILERSGSSAVLIDRDPNAVAQLRSVFASHADVEIIQQSFQDASQALAGKRTEQFDLILADLGVSSPHFDNAARGFSLQLNGPLDMRMDTTQALSAHTVVNTYSTEELVRILRQYGEEPKARRMADTIISHRPIETTQELAAVAKKVWPGYSRTHPATRLFQAVRIEVNDELGQLERSLPHLLALLKPSGRLAIITFHSLEDRIVKRFFKGHGGEGYDALLTELTKKPVVAGPNEIVNNPRARSAKMRVAKRK